MNPRIQIPFDSIESAEQYVRLLDEAVTEAKRDIGDQIKTATGRALQRRLEALRLVDYHLEKLHQYLSRSGRTLNDLRFLRRLLLEERPAAKQREGAHRDVGHTSHLASTRSATAPLVGQTSGRPQHPSYDDIL